MIGSAALRCGCGKEKGGHANERSPSGGPDPQSALRSLAGGQLRAALRVRLMKQLSDWQGWACRITPKASALKWARMPTPLS